MTSTLSGWANNPRQLLASVRLPGPIADGAVNAFDDDFAALAQRLIAIGHENAIVRIGWELNCTWMPWYAGSDPTSFRKCWKNIVRAMRTATGQAFKFDWCVFVGQWMMGDPTLAYPGDDFVDYIGVDIYDTSGPTDAERVADWKAKANGAGGLDYWAAFAAVHGKRASLPEWGLCPAAIGGGGDSAYFIEKIAKWLELNNAAYASYFNADATGYGIGDHRICATPSYPAAIIYPQAAARYQQLF